MEALAKDFTPLLQRHRQILEEQGGEVDRMIALRRDLHKYPEGGLNCYRTQQVIKDALLSFGVEAEQMRTAA